LLVYAGVLSWQGFQRSYSATLALVKEYPIYEIHHAPASYDHIKINYLVLNFISMHLSLPGKLLVVFCVFGLFITNAYGQIPVKKYEKEWKRVRRQFGR